MTKSSADREKLADDIRSVYVDVFAGLNASEPKPVLEEQSVLLESGLDSLGFAILVTRLEEQLGYDPFSLSEVAYYPQTFGEFVDYYHENCPT